MCLPLAPFPSLLVLCSPYVWEFSRLNLQYVMLSKRNILKLVRDAAGLPLGWQTVGWWTVGRLLRASLWRWHHGAPPVVCPPSHTLPVMEHRRSCARQATRCR